MFPCKANRINRIVAMQGHLTPKERRAAIRLIVAETALEAERDRYAGGGGYDRATRLMRPLLFLREPRRAYNCFLRETTVRVDPKKKCFVIRKSPPAVPGCRNKINKKGDLTIGFGYGRSPRLPATLAQAKKAWKLVITVLGITDNDLRCMAAETDEEQLFGSDHEGSVHSDSSGYSDMPPLMPASVTAESLRDEPISSTDEEPSSTDAEAEAMEVTAGSGPSAVAIRSQNRQGMQVTAGSSTDEPGNTYAGLILNFDQKPFWPDIVKTGFWPADNQLHHLVTAGHGWLSLSGSHTIMPRYSLRPVLDRYWHSLQLPLPRLRITVMSPVRSSSFRAVRSRAETVALYEAAPIVEQPDTLVMLTPHHEPHLAAMTGLDSPCRECVSWHQPYYLRLLLSQWRKITEENPCRASRACSVNKKPRIEYF